MGEFSKGGHISFYMRKVINCCIDFRRRFLSLLSFKFREFGSVTALSVLEAANIGVKKLDEEKTRGKLVSTAFYVLIDEHYF
jgi:hypothetical protein